MPDLTYRVPTGAGSSLRTHRFGRIFGVYPGALDRFRGRCYRHGMKQADVAGGPIQALVRSHGTRALANRHIHVSPEFRFIYFSNPKVACSSTKATLNLAVAERQGIPLKITSMEEVHSRGHNPLLTPRKMGWKQFGKMLEDPEVFRFTFVRDPLKRFVSAYRSKLDANKRGSGQTQRLFAHMGWPKDYPLTLAEFACLVRTEPEVLDLDPHWRPQRRQIGFDAVDFDFIGDHAAFDRDFGLVAQRIFGGPLEVFDTRKAFERYTRVPHEAEVTDEIRKAVAEAYAEDYAMLDEIRDRGLGQLAA